MIEQVFASFFEGRYDKEPLNEGRDLMRGHYRQYESGRV